MPNSLFSIFESYPKLVIALSEKKDGSMKFSENLSEEKIFRKNRKKFLEKLGIDIKKVVSGGLIHREKVKIVSKKEAGSLIPKTDGLLTKEKNLFLTITVADCLPIFLYDFKKEIVGLIHGGWQSLAKNILTSAIKKLTNNFKSNPKTILAGIGPGISSCHYQVGEELIAKFQSLSAEIFIRKENKLFLDLKKVAKIQLINLGLKKENIEINPDCTYCLSDKYFSWRRDKPKIPEVMIAVIGMRS